jgi:uncharacterized protein YidB (DUF937 family)
MGLMDVLNGMKNGPRGQVGSSATTGGMSPLTMGLLALLAYKALKAGGILGTGTAQPQAAGSATHPTQSSSGAGDWLGGLGGLIGGGAAGSILTGGLGELVKKFQQSGQGKIAQSWIGTGPNAAVSPNDLEKAVGIDTLDVLSQQTGMSRDQVLAELTEQLPKTVDSLTPQGRIPSEHEAARWA